MKIIRCRKGVYINKKECKSLIVYVGKNKQGDETYLLKAGRGKKVIYRIFKSIIYDILEEKDIYLD